MSFIENQDPKRKENEDENRENAVQDASEFHFAMEDAPKTDDAVSTKELEGVCFVETDPSAEENEASSVVTEALEGGVVKDEATKACDVSIEESEVSDSDEEEMPTAEEAAVIAKPSLWKKAKEAWQSWSRSRKIVISLVAALLALLMLLGGVGVAVFYHYYGKLNVVGREEIDAEERILKLFDAETGEHYTIVIDLNQLSDEQVDLIDDWFVTGKELVISVPSDPNAMTKQEHAAFVGQIILELMRLQDNGGEHRLVIMLHNQKDGKDYDWEIDSKLIAEGEDYVSIMEYIETKADQRLTISFDKELSSLSTDEKKQLYIVIAKAIRDEQRERYIVKLQGGVDAEVIEFAIYKEEVTEEQAMALVKLESALVLTLPEDLGALDEEARANLIATIVEMAEDRLIPRYTLLLRNPTSGAVYGLVIKKNELSEGELLTIIKQIDRGVLDVSIDKDPVDMTPAEREQLIRDVFTAIDLLENPPKIYQLKLMDRASGKQYVLTFDEKQVSEAQLVELLTALTNDQTVILNVEKAPDTMTEAELDALIAAVVKGIQHPLRLLTLTDKSSGKQYPYYFYDEELSAERLQYFKQQIASGKKLSVAISKSPDSMAADEKELLIKNIIAAIKGEQVSEYRIPVRDRESGKAYVLKFTKLEVEDVKVFGYLLEQTQRGGVLEMSIGADPATMSLADRKALFASAAEAIKEKINEESNPELLQQMIEHLNSIAKNPVQHNSDIYNVLLVGTDEREQYDSKNADTMILVTINYKDETITMTSLMRDTCVKIKYMSGGKERELSTKLNHAYALGGIKTLITTLETNFGLQIDNYVQVNWTSFIDVFEVLGSIKVNVKNNNKDRDDLETLNGVLVENCQLFGYDYASNVLTGYGEQYLNPVQLLAFVRYRTGDADFGRTTRQREALVAVFNKFKSSSLVKINDVLEATLPLLTTDLSEGNCASLLLKFPSIVGFKMQQHRFPLSSEFTSKEGMLWPDWQKALSSMYQRAYGSLCPEQYK